MIFSNDRTTKDALLNTLSEGRRQHGCARSRRQHGRASMRSRSIAAPVNLSTIERSPPPRDWTLPSPRSSRRVADGLKPTGPFELLQDAGGLTPG